MFANFIKTVAVTTMIGLGAAVTTATPAAAGGVGINIQIGAPGYGPGPYWGPKPGPKGGYCQNYKAVQKAHWYGVKKAYVVKKTPYKVIVKGWSKGYQRKVVLANNWNCPVLAVY